jgi:hypothetical protein
LRTTGLRHLRTETKSETSLRHHAEAEAKAALTAAALSAASLLTAALRCRTETKAALTAAALSAACLLTAALRCRAEALRCRAEALRAALCHTKTKALLSALCTSAEAKALRSALERSGLPSAEGRLCIHDSGCSDSGEKDPGDCECKNLVHSSLLDSVVCGFRFYFIGSSSRMFKNASFPPIQRPASKKNSF